MGNQLSENLDLEDDENSVHAKSTKRLNLGIQTDRQQAHIVYYGYFLTQETSKLIEKVVDKQFRILMDQVQPFREFFNERCRHKNITDPFEYYNNNGGRQGKKPKVYHVTTKFLGARSDDVYHELVAPLMKSKFYMHLVAITFSPKTIGVHVELTNAQLSMFEGDGVKSMQYPNILQNLDIGKLQSRIKKENESHIETLKDCKPQNYGRELIFFKKSGKDQDQMQQTFSTAHITIGTSMGVKPKQTGHDIAHVIELEKNAKQKPSLKQNFKVDNGTLTHFCDGKSFFVFYSDTEMIVPGIFDTF